MRRNAKRTRGLLPLAVAVAVASVLGIPAAQATRDPLDTSFGSGGKVTTSFSSGADVATAVAIQPDGKIIAVGYGHAESGFALARYNANGSLDTGFGSGGKVTTAIGLGGGQADAVVLQPDGKIVVGGTSYPNLDFTLARYNANGSLDTSFGTSGIVTTDVLGADDVVTGLVLQPDGKIVAAGQAHTSSSQDFALVRYTAGGAIDSSFGTNGKTTTSFGSAPGVANALVRQPDGKLVVAGYTGTPASSDFALARYTTSGSLDPTFGSGGKVTTAIAGSQGAYAAALQPDGKIVAVGDTVGGDFEVAVLRYDANGTLDPSFGDAGVASGDEGIGYAVAVQPDGKIVVAGQGFNADGSHTAFSVSRFDPDGSEDLSFGTDGAGGLTTSFGSGDDDANAVALQPDGKIVVAGSTTVTPGSDYNFALARYLGSTLTVTKRGKGVGTVTSSPVGIHCGPTCSAPFADVPVTLTAKASARAKFAGWSGACSGKRNCVVTMSTSRSVSAKFVALCVVPKVKGKKLRNAKRAIRRAHCSVGKIRRAFSAKVAKGRVISQHPHARRKLHPHSKIRLTVSKGRR